MKSDYNCYIKGCKERAAYCITSGDDTYAVCDDHYDDATIIINGAQDRVLKEKRDARDKIRHLSVDSS